MKGEDNEHYSLITPINNVNLNQTIFIFLSSLRVFMGSYWVLCEIYGVIMGCFVKFMGYLLDLWGAL